MATTQKRMRAKSIGCGLIRDAFRNWHTFLVTFCVPGGSFFFSAFKLRRTSSWHMRNWTSASALLFGWSCGFNQGSFCTCRHYILGKTIGEGTFGKVKVGNHILTGCIQHSHDQGVLML
eukprot:3402131-Amphidinium_carterae.1